MPRATAACERLFAMTKPFAPQRKDLVNRHHARANEVEEKCMQLCLQRDGINDLWEER